jgi:hypothetical protein
VGEAFSLDCRGGTPLSQGSFMLGNEMHGDKSVNWKMKDTKKNILVLQIPSRLKSRHRAKGSDYFNFKRNQEFRLLINLFGMAI